MFLPSRMSGFLKCFFLCWFLFLFVQVVSSFGKNPFEVNKSKDGGSPMSDLGDQCFCKLEGQISDCKCSVETVDYFNNMKIFPRINSLLQKPYFKFFRYNANKKCPFWDMTSGKCANPTCGVQPCTPDEIPPGLKGEVPSHKYTEQAQEDIGCQKEGTQDESEAEIDSKVDVTLSEKMRQSIREWQDHDESMTQFCDIDAETCPNCDYVDLTLNPERFTGYSGEAATRVWKAIYEENCFKPPNKATFLRDSVEEMCLEKRAFFRVVSGLHSSISIHLCANYLMQTSDSPFLLAKDKWGPNVEEFQRRFDPLTTQGQGPYWLRNLYFVYLLELRALTKAAPYLEHQSFFTGKLEEDKDTQIAVKELLNLLRSFPNQFDESTMFTQGMNSKALKLEFQNHFRNISRIMDCVGCDKCKLWGKLQVTGLGTALKILFSEGKSNRSAGSGIPGSMMLSSSGDLNAYADHLQRFHPPDMSAHVPDYGLSRNEIVSLFNAFGRISTSIQQVERFRTMIVKN